MFRDSALFLVVYPLYTGSSGRRPRIFVLPQSPISFVSASTLSITLLNSAGVSSINFSLPIADFPKRSRRYADAQTPLGSSLRYVTAEKSASIAASCLGCTLWFVKNPLTSSHLAGSPDGNSLSVRATAAAALACASPCRVASQSSSSVPCGADFLSSSSTAVPAVFIFSRCSILSTKESQSSAADAGSADSAKISANIIAADIFFISVTPLWYLILFMSIF